MAAGTTGRRMQADGNFVIYGPAGALWATNMTGFAGVSVVAKNDASLVSLLPRRHRGLGTA
jgi:hypothetical protein